MDAVEQYIGETPWRRNLRRLYSYGVRLQHLFAFQTPVTVIEPNTNWSSAGPRDYKQRLVMGGP